MIHQSLFTRPLPLSRFGSQRKTSLSLALVTALIAGLVAAPQVAQAAARNQTAKPAGPPKTIVVSLSQQKLVVYEGTKAIASSRISSGKRGHRTPKGVFTILQKRRRHFSNLYAGAPMPYMQRVTWSGIAFHAGQIPGYPASHGCIRLPYGFAKKLFSMTSMADRVVVTDGRVAPRIIKHDNLIKPLPPGDPSQTTAHLQADKSDAASGGTAQWLMGVSPANAANVYGDLHAIHRGPMTRASVAATRQHHLDRLTKMSADAKAWATEAADKLKTANLELRDLIKTPRKLQADIGETKLNLRKRIAEKRSIEREMRDFILSARSQLEAPATGAPILPLRTAKLETGSVLTPAAPRLVRSDASDAPVETAALTSPSPEDFERQEAEIEQRLLAKMAEIDALKADIAKLEQTLAGHSDAVEAAKTRRNILKERYTTAYRHYLRIKQDQQKAAAAQKRYNKPITVLISRKHQKLYVRQDQADVLEAPITIADSDKPIGTHVFTAMTYAEGETDLRWKAITPARGKIRSAKRPRGMSKREWRLEQRAAAKRAATKGQTAEKALSRITIPADLRTRLAELIKPGSAILIHDKGKSLETGKYTDLIVQF